MISVELIKQKDGNPDQVELFLDKEGLEFLFNQLNLLRDQKTDHIHFMSEEWGMGDLQSIPRLSRNTTIHHLKIYLVQSV